MQYPALATQQILEPPPPFVKFDDGLGGVACKHVPEKHNGRMMQIFTVGVPGGWRSLYLFVELH